MGSETAALQCAQTSPSSFSGIFLTILSALMVEKDKFNEMGSKVYPDDYGPKLLAKRNKPFDFIIVGAGPGGCVLANKLTQNPQWSVLLLEAGDAPSTNTEIPYLYPTLASSEDTWTFTSHSDSFCKGSLKEACKFTKGKGLGGSSTINNLHYERGSQGDFKHFDGWSYRDILQNYERLEKYEGNQTTGSLLGTNGELILNDLTSTNHVLAEVIFDSAKELAYDQIVNPMHELGFKTAIGTIVNGERNNVAKAFLGPVRCRSNLYVARNSLVTKIVTNLPQDRRVTGVEVQISNEMVQVNAKREVILCAGAINTPKLLLLSGFGPHDHLKHLGVSTIVDLPVGKNLRDQIGLPIFVGLHGENGENSTTKTNAKTEELDATYYYLAHRKGKLSGTGLNAIIGSINTRKDPYSTPNIKMYHQFFERNDSTFAPFLQSFGYKPSFVNTLKNFNRQLEIIVFVPTLIRTESIGELTLQNTKPDSTPVINGNYVSDPQRSDYYSLVSAYEFVRAFVDMEPLAKKCKGHLLDVQLDECRNYNATTDQYVNCYIRSVAIPVGQVVGTAKMGDSNLYDDLVVNEELLVEGIRHLRIVDASVIPEPISANVECTVAMMGMKIAEVINRKWSK